MRLAPILPALIVAITVQGPAQNSTPLPPSVEPAAGLLTAPASASPSNSVGTTGVTTVNTGGQVTSSTSATKQFIVYGADLQTRGAFCLLCEDIATNLGRLLKDDGRFALPIVVVLKTPPNINLSEPVITTSFSQLAYGGFHLQINAELRRDFNAEDFSKELVRMLLAERILRNHKEVQTTRSQLLSGWLLTGVTQAMEFRSRSRPSALFAAVFRSGQVYSIDRIIEANPKELDALARGIYETSSCALVLALLDQADGGLRFSRFLSALANGKKGDRELLKEHFPTLGVSKNSLEKWWTLQMASLATPSTFESMSYVQTEEALETALTFHIPDLEPGSKPASHPRTEAQPTAQPEAQPEKKSRSWFRFGRKDKDASETEGEEKKTEPAKEEAKAQPQPAPAPAKPTATATPTTPGTPAPSPAAEPEKPAEKKSFFNFSGGRKIATPIKAKPEDVDGQTPARPAATAAAPAANASANAPATPAANAATPAPAEEKKPRGFRGLFGRKKAEPEPTPAPTPAQPEAAKPTTTARKPQVKKTAPATVEKSEEKKPAPATTKEEESEEKTKSDKPSEDMAKGKDEEEAKTDAPTTPDPEFVGPPVPVEIRPAIPPAEVRPELAMPAHAGERRPDEPLPPGLSPVPPAPGDPAAMASPQMPLPFLPEPTPAPPDFTADKEDNLPPLGRPSNPDLLPLEDFAKLAKRKDRNEILKRTLNQINSVKLRAHPLYRPVVGEYATVIQNLMLGRESGITEQLAAIRKQHLQVREQARAVDSYVDWYEASQTETYSHVFDDYLKLRDDLDKDVIPRADAVSRYLDAIQQEFEE